MRNTILSFVSVLLLVGLAVHLADARPAAGSRARLVIGTHHVIGLRHPLGPPAVSVGTGLATFDAAGALDFVSTDNDSGVVSGPSLDTGSTYTVSGKRLVKVITSSLEDALGGTSKTGDITAGANISAGSDPSIAIFTKRAGTHSDASLSGEWFLTGFLYDHVGGTNTGFTGIADFDGAGAYTVTTTDNEDGVVTGPNADAGTYAVAADGSLTVNNSMGDPLEGGVNEADDFAIIGGFAVGGEPPVAALLLEKDGTYTARSFKGTYYLVVFEYNVSAGEYRTATGTLKSNGRGTFTIDTFDNDAGVASTTMDGGTYTVAADGTFTVLTGGGDTLLGGLGQGGQIGIVGGGISAGSDPLVAIVIKR